MTLLLNTNIKDEVKLNIKGNIARVGGTVNQLVDYKNNNCSVTDINVIDGGYGIIRQLGNIKSLKETFETAKKFTKQKIGHLTKGDEICRDWKTIILDMHFAYQHPELKHKYDSVISSNVLEHSPNPILLLLNFYFITKIDGYQFHAIPHFKYTFDMYRKPTSIDHMFEDFENNTNFDDTSHNEDYIQSAIVKHGYFKEFHKKNPVAYPLMHFHVFDENNIRELFNSMFIEVKNDILKTDRISDNVVLYKNQLKSEFVNKYKEKILSYSENFLN